MKCPACKSKLSRSTHDNQIILHCARCGGSFFEQNGINRISLKTAGELAVDRSERIPLPLNLDCPNDNSLLIRITDEEAIPIDVEIFRCPTCYGLYAPADDLKKFKKAQRAKIQFFKIWGKPMPSPRAVLAFTVMGFVGLSLVLSLIVGNTRLLSTTSADQVVRSVYVKKDQKMAFISFITSADYRSNIKIRNSKTGEKKTIVVSKDPTQVHVATLNDLKENDEFSYQIILIDSKGKEILSKEAKLK